VSQVKAARNGKHLWTWDRAVLGVSTPGNERTNEIADIPVMNIGPDLLDRSRHLETRDIGRPGWWWIAALPLHDIRTVHACGGHLDEDVAGANRWTRTLHRRQDLGFARLSNLNRDHFNPL
jgi:hypothetical protein